MPTPRPDRSVTWAAVEKPGAKIRSMTSSSDMASRAACERDIALARDLADPRHVDAAAVVLDLDHHVLALAGGPQARSSPSRACRAAPVRLRLRARGPGRCAGHEAAARRSPRRSSCRPPSWRPRSSGAPACRATAAISRTRRGKRWKACCSGRTRRLSTDRCSSPTRRSSSRCWFFERDGELARIAGVLRALGGMADGVLGDQQLAGQPDERVDPVDIDAQSGVGRLGGQRARAARARGSARPSGSGRWPPTIDVASPASRLLCSRPSRSVASSDRP